MHGKHGIIQKGCENEVKLNPPERAKTMPKPKAF